MTNKELVAMLYSKYGKMQLTKAETAHEIGVSIATLDNMRRDGLITGKKVSHQIFFTLTTIVNHLSEQIMLKVEAFHSGVCGIEGYESLYMVDCLRVTTPLSNKAKL